MGHLKQHRASNTLDRSCRASSGKVRQGCEQLSGTRSAIKRGINGRDKRLRLAFLSVAARLVRHGRRLHLRFGATYPHLQAFHAALNRLRAMPAFG